MFNGTNISGKDDRKKTKKIGNFPGGSVVKTLPSNAGAEDLIPGQRSQIAHVTWPDQILKEKSKQMKKKEDGHVGEK